LRVLAVSFVALTLAGAAGAARVPDGVSSIRIHTATGLTTTVIDPRAVRDIVAWFDALPHRVVRSCARESYYPPDVTFDFRAPGRGVVLHAVDHAPGTCPSAITLNGQSLAEDNFVARVAKRVGVDIDPNRRTAANELLAERDAASHLQLAVAPPGSRRLTTA